MQTPYFTIHQAELDQSIGTLKHALSIYWPDAIVGYSVKTNSMPWLLRYMRKQGFFAEVVSDDEYAMAKHCGFPISSIIYNGIAKTESTFLEAVSEGAVVNLDSWQELQWLRKLDANASYQVGLRVNFDLESMCPGETACGLEGGRFGFCYETGELEKALHELRRYPWVSLAGLHLHCSSKTRSLEIYRAIAKVACKIAETYDLHLKYIDVGGGFYGGLPNKPQFQDYLSVLQRELAVRFSAGETTLILEPGMALIGSPVTYTATVTDVKETSYNRFVVTDGSRIHIDPLMHKNSYFYEIIRQRPDYGEVLKRQVVCGFTCMEADRLFSVMDSPPLQVGDRICFHKVGAYTMNLAPQFIRYFPPVYLYQGSEHILIQDKWSVEDVARE